jgi:hypothetical protein
MAYIEDQFEDVNLRISEIEKKLSAVRVVYGVPSSHIKALEDNLSMLQSIRDLLLEAMNQDRATG